MAKTAILVDGGFYRRVSRSLWGKKEAEDRAAELYQYAILHITEKRDAKVELDRRELYRIFYYDCPPVKGVSAYHPLKGGSVHFTERDEAYVWNTAFHKAFGEKRKVALRFGKRIVEHASYVLTPEATKRLFKNEASQKDLADSDFKLDMKQSGVDMRIGLDIASLAYEGIVDQVILISGDVDFVPAAKVARRRGIDFIVDNMNQPIRDDLKIHADGIVSMVDKMDALKSKSKRRKRKR